MIIKKNPRIIKNKINKTIIIITRDQIKKISIMKKTIIKKVSQIKWIKIEKIKTNKKKIRNYKTKSQ